MIDKLYQKAILSQAARATGHGRPADSDISYTLQNPLCGDRITVHLSLENNRISSMGHETKACVLCQANAALLAETAPGETVESLEQVQSLLLEGLESDALENVDWPAEKWQQLSIFSPVAEHKNRYRCVTLPFEALIRAMSGETDD
ncbi:iron-sulfur cluster assembly scaffold protein [Emcibacter nanhaiensis]|uniref:Iron-sulfur cluster assembly scaffold protein n=1 Tax=Emcibacter nanhaiensis TaxID=1505037 RepID=A0A501PQD1_9PROT|nr:iron-sulfur cluster assembly scaffold protein [Emcibacter nanhaiensis]TPD62663.1 iron-sulfur cluster assembly scaffold protein [Emcibacter nanhaiensis]